jgi:ribosomal protein L24
MKQLPQGYHVDFKYVCPKCESDHWTTQEEARVKGFKIVCYCGKVMEIEPVTVSKVNIRKVDNKPASTPKPKPAPAHKNEVPKDSDTVDMVIVNVTDGLVRLGFKKGEAKRLCIQLYKDGMTEEQLLQKVMTNATFGNI